MVEDRRGCSVLDEGKWTYDEALGTPQECGRGWEQWLEASTEKEWEDNSDLNQSKAMLETPNQED